jgi:2-methylcitrate dehydratase
LTTGIRTKEEADHNLSYLLAVALMDGDVVPAQFRPERITRPDVQALLRKVSDRPCREYTEQYPRKMPSKITRLQDGSVIAHEVRDYPGLASRPFTWEDSVAEFDTLVPGIGQGVCREIKDAVQWRDIIQARVLKNLLGKLS